MLMASQQDVGSNADASSQQGVGSNADVVVAAGRWPEC